MNMSAIRNRFTFNCATSMGLPAIDRITGLPHSALLAPPQTDSAEYRHTFLLEKLALVMSSRRLSAVIGLLAAAFLILPGATSHAQSVYYTVSAQSAGTGSISSLGSSAPVAAGLNRPAGLAVDSAGNVYYGDYSNGNGYILHEVFSGGGGQSFGTVTPPLTVITPFVFAIAVNTVGDVYYTADIPGI